MIDTSVSMGCSPMPGHGDGDALSVVPGFRRRAARGVRQLRGTSVRA